MNPIFSSMNKVNISTERLNNVLSVMNTLKGKNPSEVTTELLKTNPQFKEFYEMYKDKNVEEICKDYGIDMSLIRQLLK